MRFFQGAVALSLSALLTTALVGCNGTTSTETVNSGTPSIAAATPVNEYCPMMSGKVTEEGGTVQWNGKTIGFCCDGCDEKWNALSEEEKAQKLAAAQAKEDAGADSDAHQHGDHEHS